LYVFSQRVGGQALAGKELGAAEAGKHFGENGIGGDVDLFAGRQPNTSTADVRAAMAI
jgi:hypothetical protein